MTILRSTFSLFIFFFLVYSGLDLTVPVEGCCYTRFFAFGDSITDNGNWMHYAVPPGPVALLPYGETYFEHPTGRFSNGRLIIDFISEALHMPYLTPYLAGNSSKDFRYGANFAVGGATALNQEYFEKKGLAVYFIPYSLETQISWFEELLKKLGSSEWERRKIASTSLFLLGEIGGNDYNQPLWQNISVEETKSYIPDVINVIGAAITNLTKLGARTIVVPGNFPVGCVPGTLTLYPSENASDYDQYGCLKWANELAELHNTALKIKLRQLKRRNPGVTLIYADYYGATLSFTENPTKYGFEDVLDACCGAGGPYNVNPLINCALNGTHACPDPSKYVSWDGLHLTEQAYKYIANDILNGPYAQPPILAKCKWCRTESLATVAESDPKQMSQI